MVNRINLTQTKAEGLRAQATALVYWDQNLPGFGIRVSPKGRKTFICQYRVRQADGALKENVETLGTLDFLTVKDARERARKSKAKASEGIDPVEEKGRQSKRCKPPPKPPHLPLLR